MRFIRSVLYFFVWWSFTFVWGFVCLFTCWLPFKGRYQVASIWARVTTGLAWLICGIKYQVKGTENLPDAPVVLMCKHQSTWETLFMMLVMPRPVSFVMKKSLLYIPFFGWILAFMRMIPIDRSQRMNAFRQMVQIGRQRLKEGHWIIIFPEGTRVPPGQKGDYQSGGAMLAIRTKAQVVPIALNSGECWPKTTIVKTPGMITLSIGKPIETAGRKADDVTREVEAWIEGEMRQISPHMYPETK